MKNKTAIGITILGIMMAAFGFLLIASIPVPKTNCTSGCDAFVEMPVEYFILFFAGLILFLIGLIWWGMNVRQILKKYEK